MSERSTDKAHFENPTKNRLKTMSKNGNGHFFRTRLRIIKYGLSGLIRHIWLSLAATIVTIFTLVILFITIIASVILSSTADYMRQKIDITIYFNPGTSQEALDSMAATMKRDSNVTSVEVADSATEYDRFLSETEDDEDILKALSDDEMRRIMIDSMPATMRVKVADSNNLDSIKNIVVSDLEFVEYLDADEPPTYDVNSTEIATITSWANIAKNGGLILSAIFLVVSVLVIFNTIRMAIFSRREEIYMEKLIGADNRFIRGPFVVEAEGCGIVAGIIAGIIGLVGFNLVSPRLAAYGIQINSVSAIFSSNLVFAVFISMILTGWLINVLSARLAIHKYLK